MPLAVVEVTLVTVGAVVSMTMFLLAPSEPRAPGVGSVRVALLVAASLIVPPLSVRADVARVVEGVAFWPAATV